MKHLIMYNHLGDKVLDKEVFVEGQDFEWSTPTPIAYWLGKIILVDKEPEPEKQEEAIVEPEPEPEFETQEQIDEEIRLEAETQAYIDKQKEEVTEVEPETVSDKSTGDKGTGEAEQLESLEITPEANTGGDAIKGGEGRGQSSTTSHPLGSRTKRQPSTSYRGKAKAVDVGGF